LKIILTDKVETVLNLHRCYPGELVLDLRACRDGSAEICDRDPTYFWVETLMDKKVARQLLSTIEGQETIYVIGTEERWAEIQTGESQEQMC